MKDYENINYTDKKEIISFEDKKKVKDTISKLMKLGYSEDEARVQIAMWIENWK